MGDGSGWHSSGGAAGVRKSENLKIWESGSLGVWESGKSRNLEIWNLKTSKTEILRMKIRAVPNVCKLLVRREKHMTLLGAISQILSTGCTDAEICDVCLFSFVGQESPILPVWGNGQTLLLSTLGGQIGIEFSSVDSSNSAFSDEVLMVLARFFPSLWECCGVAA